MSSDYSARARRIEKMNTMLGHLGHHQSYAERVEKVVYFVFGSKREDFRVHSRARQYAHPRFVLFSILWQEEGIRSLSWLARRYNLDHKSVYEGIKRVKTLPDLMSKEITVMCLLERQLEVELYGKTVSDDRESSSHHEGSARQTKEAVSETALNAQPSICFDAT